MMKIIFLDIDGVLNSRTYDSIRTAQDGNIDKTRLVLLRELVERTGAKIVLSSTWREHWDPQGDGTDAVGMALEREFGDAGIELYDKTPVIDNSRALEIRVWLNDHPDVQSFVIIDDIKFGWGELEPRTVRTDYRICRGLERTHIEMAVALLNN